MTQNIYEALTDIQKNLKAPKSKFNKFGDYYYRSLEDILEGVKEHLPKGGYVTLSDELVQVGERFYIKATASFHYKENHISTSGYAREDIDRKKMHPEQLTGSSSSYARKYALNGLFCIDDTKDADSDKPPQEEITDEHKKEQRDFHYEIACCQHDFDVTATEEQIQASFLPKIIKEGLMDHAGNIKIQIENGVDRTPVKWGFISVPEAVQFAKDALQVIDGANNTTDLSTWIMENDHKLRALDDKLTAAKYQSEEGSPYQRIVRKYELRITELKPMQEAAE